jgi:hypothetical protein
MTAGLLSWGQQSTSGAQPPQLSVDLGVTMAFERAYIAPGNCNCFWFKGGGADAAFTFWKGLGYAAAISGDHASNAAPGIDVNKFTYLFGPRYTFSPLARNQRLQSLRNTQAFGESLFGSVHAFNSSFPSGGGLRSSADSFAMQLGGGIQFPLARGFMLRALQADYARTSLPNNFSNYQNDLRLGFGINYHVNLSQHPR